MFRLWKKMGRAWGSGNPSNPSQAAAGLNHTVGHLGGNQGQKSKSGEVALHRRFFLCWVS